MGSLTAQHLAPDDAAVHAESARDPAIAARTMHRRRRVPPRRASAPRVRQGCRSCWRVAVQNHRPATMPKGTPTSNPTTATVTPCQTPVAVTSPRVDPKTAGSRCRRRRRRTATTIAFATVTPTTSTSNDASATGNDLSRTRPSMSDGPAARSGRPQLPERTQRAARPATRNRRGRRQASGRPA